MLSKLFCYTFATKSLIIMKNVKSQVPVIVRFCPSPTGAGHIGGVRTALYNYLFAKKMGGNYLLRIEDTDQDRYVAGAEQYMIDSLKWCGIEFTDGVHLSDNPGFYRQSDRKAAGIYATHIKTLLDNGSAYYAFDTKDELEAMRNRNNKYDAAGRVAMRNSITLPSDTVAEYMTTGVPYVIRFKTAKGATIVVNDMIRGNVTFNSDTLDDKVLMKSDGMPTYHFANVVDDYDMNISHVIRGEEWLPSAPLHVALYKAFGWNTPVFAHLPLLLKPEGKGKLSKRDGALFGFPVIPIGWDGENGYKEEGYFPEVLMNFLAILSWSPGNNEEIMTMDRMIEVFDLEKVSKNGCRFLIDKLKHMNGIALRSLSVNELYPLVLPFIPVDVDRSYLENVIFSLHDRVNTLRDFYDMALYYFHDDFPYDPAMVAKWSPDASTVIAAAVSDLSSLDDWTSASIHDMFFALADTMGIKAGKVMPAMRCAITGAAFGAPVFEIAELIGKDRTMVRLLKAIEKFS